MFIYLFVYLFVYLSTETERLKREEMDRTLANKLIETKEVAGVQTWLSRELIGFNHTKNRFVLLLELLSFINSQLVSICCTMYLND